MARKSTLMNSGLKSDGRFLDRSEISIRHKWNEFGNYKTHADWAADLPRAAALGAALQKFKGKLGDGPEVLASCFSAFYEYQQLMEKLSVHASIQLFQNQNDSQAQKRLYKLGESQQNVNLSFVNEELFSLSPEKIEEYKKSSAMKPYLRAFNEYLRSKSHSLSEKQGDIVSTISNSIEGSEFAYEMVLNNKIRFEKTKVADSKGNILPLSAALYGRLIYTTKRDVRKNVYEAYYSKFYSQREFLCSNLDGYVKKNFLAARMQKFKTCIEAALFNDDVPVSLIDSLITAVHESLPSFYNYLALRQRVLDIPVLDSYDVLVSIVDYGFCVPYDVACQWILEAVAPLGFEYLAAASKGLKEERWAEVFQSAGKKGGAFSMPNYEGPKYMLLNYNGSLKSVYALAHELGHSMHSYLSSKAQPFQYSSPSILVGEVASTMNETLLFEYLSKKAHREKRFLQEAYLLNCRCDDIRAKIFRQVQYAEFERAFHGVVEKGGTLTPDVLSRLYMDTNDLHYGDIALANPRPPLAALTPGAASAVPAAGSEGEASWMSWMAKKLNFFSSEPTPAPGPAPASASASASASAPAPAPAPAPSGLSSWFSWFGGKKEGAAAAAAAAAAPEATLSAEKSAAASAALMAQRMTRIYTHAPVLQEEPEEDEDESETTGATIDFLASGGAEAEAAAGTGTFGGPGSDKGGSPKTGSPKADSAKGEGKSAGNVKLPHVYSANPLTQWEWMSVPHFYMNFYVYKYATSMSVSDILVPRILEGADKKTHLNKYLNMLKAGCSKDPLDLLAEVGVDIRTPAPFVAALNHFGELVKQLDDLYKSGKVK